MDPDPGKGIDVDPKRGSKWIRIRPNVVDLMDPDPQRCLKFQLFIKYCHGLIKSALDREEEDVGWLVSLCPTNAAAGDLFMNAVKMMWGCGSSQQI